MKGRILAAALFKRLGMEGIKIEERRLPFRLVSDTGEDDVLVRVPSPGTTFSKPFYVSRAAIESCNLGADEKSTFLRVRVVVEEDNKVAISIPSNHQEQLDGLGIGHLMVVDQRSLLTID